MGRNEVKKIVMPSLKKENSLTANLTVFYIFGILVHKRIVMTYG
jgi:hypothetical protein